MVPDRVLVLHCDRFAFYLFIDCAFSILAFGVFHMLLFVEMRIPTWLFSAVCEACLQVVCRSIRFQHCAFSLVVCFFFVFLLCSVALSFAPFPEAGAGTYVEVGPQKPSLYTQFISHGDVLRHFHFGSCPILQCLISKRMSYPLRIVAYFFHWKNQYGLTDDQTIYRGEFFAHSAAKQA